MAEILTSTEIQRKKAVNVTLCKAGPIGKTTCLVAALLIGLTASAFTVTTIVTSATYQPPKVRPDSFRAFKNTPIDMPVLANDTGKDRTDNLTIVQKEQSAAFVGDWLGALTLRTTYKKNGIIQRYHFEPHAPHYAGVFTYDYWVSNIKGAVRNAKVTVTIVNRPPQANDDPHSDSSVKGSAYNLAKNKPDQTLDVLHNDVDPDSDDLFIVSCNFDSAKAYLDECKVSSDGKRLHVSTKQGVTTVTPFTFQYTISDNNDTDSATVRARILNDPPHARSDEYHLKVNHLELLGSGGKGANPLANDKDVNGDSLSITQVSFAPTNVGQQPKGHLESFLDTDQQWKFRYYPDPIFAGASYQETFNYEVSDGTERASANVRLFFTSDPPVTNPGSVTLPKHSSQTSLSPINFNDAASFPRPFATYHSSIVKGVEEGSLSSVETSGSTRNPTVFWPKGTTNTYPVPTFTRSFDYTPRAAGQGKNAGYQTSFDFSITDGFHSSQSRFTINVVNSPPVATNKAFTCEKKTTCNSWNLLAGDSDPNAGDTVSFVSASPSSLGSLSAGSNGIATFLAGATTGVDSVTYQITDDDESNPLTATAQITITVTNTPPVAVNDEYTINKNQKPDAFNVLANDNDPNSDALSLVSTSMKPLFEGTGSVSLVSYGQENCANSAGCVYFSPKSSFEGVTFATYQISDGDATASAEIKITVVNQPPVANPDHVVCPRNGKITIQVLDNDHDPNGDALTLLRIVSPPNKGSASVIDSKIDFFADGFGVNGGRGDVTSQTFTYEIQDSSGQKAVGTVHVEIVNTPPSTLPDSYSYHWTEGITYIGVKGHRWSSQVGVDGNALSVLDNDNDINGDRLEVNPVIVKQPTFGAFAVVFPPFLSVSFVKDTPTALGTFSFQYAADDGVSQTPGDVSVTYTNTPPVAVDDTFEIAQSALDTPLPTYTIQVLENDQDADPQDLKNHWYITSLVHVSSSPALPSSYSFSASVRIESDFEREVLYSPPLQFHGTHTFKYLMTDGASPSNWATVTVTILNTPPVATSKTIAMTQAEFKALGFSTQVEVLSGSSPLCTDRDGDSLAISVAETHPAGGKGFLTVLNSADAQYAFYPASHGQQANDVFTYQCCDSSSACDSATLTFNIAPNTPPVATPFTRSISYNRATPLDVSISEVCTDADGDSLSFLAATQTGGAPHGTFSFTASTLSFTVSGLTSDGMATVDFTCSDSLATSQSTGTVNIAYNAAPVPQDQTVSVTYNQLISQSLSPWTWTKATLCIDDEPGPVYVDTVNNNGVSGVSNTADQITFTFTENNGAGGNFVFYFTCKDDSLSSSPVQGTISVTISPNQAPTTSPRSGSVSHANSAGISFQILGGSDPACSDLEGDTLTVVMGSDPTPHAASSPTFDSLSGTITYLPLNNRQGENGVDSFTYSCSDAYNSAVGSITVTVTNQPPVATDDSVSLTKRNPANPGAQLVTVITNDYDPDGDFIHLVPGSLVHVSGPLPDSVSASGDQISLLLPNEYFTHEISPGVFDVGREPIVLGYKVDDTASQSNQAQVTITVPYNPPKANDDHYTIQQTDGSVPFTLSVLTNDEDLDGDVFTITSLSWNPDVPSNERGFITRINGNTQVQYTPPAIACGEYSPLFTYVIQTAGDGLTSQAGVHVTIDQCRCRKKLDIALVLDGSGSIHNNNWEIVRTFTRDMINSFDMTSSEVFDPVTDEYIGVNLALVQYAYDSKKCISPPQLSSQQSQCYEPPNTWTDRDQKCDSNKYCRRWTSSQTFYCCVQTNLGSASQTEFGLSHQQNTMLDKVNDMVQRKGATNTRSGIDRGWDILKGSTRSDVHQILIVFTDGYANRAFEGTTNPVPMTNSVRADGIDVYSVGVGNYYAAEVNGMAGNDPSKIFTTSDFNQMTSLIQGIINQAC